MFPSKCLTNKQVAALGGLFSLMPLDPPASDKAAVNYPFEVIVSPGVSRGPLLQAFHALQVWLLGVCFFD